MGHDHHFLERLDRVSLPHVEFALGLYRDAELVRRVLEHARVPEGAERVALALEPTADGPHVIVARDGGFVTCLGPGMSPSPWPVVPRGRIDAIIARALDLRTRVDAARALVGPNGETRKLVRKVFLAGDMLSREDFVAISSFQPLMAREFLRLMMAVVLDLEQARPTALAIERPKPMHRELLQVFWRQLWALGHLWMLATMDGPSVLDGFPPDVFDGSAPSASWGLARQFVSALALRGAWGAAKLGKPVLTMYKRRYAAADRIDTVFDAGMALATIALRHPRLHAEAFKTLSAPHRMAPAEGYQGWLTGTRAACTVAAAEGIDHAEIYLDTVRTYGSRRWMDCTTHLEVGAPMRFERAEDVPEELARALAVNDMLSYTLEFSYLRLLTMFTPWLARARPEEFYLPRAAVVALHMPWQPEHTLAILAPFRAESRKPRPVRAKVVPGRNEPCSCGSGRKYKRCCGAASSAG